MKRFLKRCLWGCAFLLLGFVTIVVGAFLWDLPPRSERDFAAFKWEWDETRMKRGNLSPDERLVVNQKFADRGLQFARRYPGTPAELAFLITLDERVPDSEAGREAGEILLKRIASADLKTLNRVCGFGILTQLSRERAAPAVFARVKQELDNPDTPRLLAHVACRLAEGDESPTPPDGFDEIASLIVDRFADSPKIYGFCESFGSGTGGPRWSPQYESHVDRILQANQHRNIRASALMAKAQIAQSCATRQEEAENRYRDFLKEFDQNVNDLWQNVINQQCHWAKLQLQSLQFAPVGRQAPELTGLDLQGEPMSLAEYKGKVVMLTFWASWCGPCMKLASHEKEIAARFAGQPFAVLGVNADKDPTHGAKVAADKGFTWRSFRDQREGTKSVSDQWEALFPTVYVIDHLGIVRYRACMLPPLELVDELVVAANANLRG